MVRKIFYILCILVVSISAQATNRYAVYTGGATSGECPVGTPCTLAFAISAADSGDTVYLNDGTYTTAQVVVPTGVSLTSTSQDNTRVILRPNADMSISVPFIYLGSASPGSAGNQTISYIEFDGINGSYEAGVGIEVRNRSDVRIHHCNIHDFTSMSYAKGVFVLSDQVAPNSSWWLYWPVDPQGVGTDTNINAVWPTNPVENFELDNNTITDCGYRQDGTTADPLPTSAAVKPWNLKNSSIHHNTIVNTSASWGQAITGTSSFLWNVDIYNNDLTMALYSTTARSSYIIELWGFRNGCEIYNNTANAAFSIIIGKELSVYDNTIIIDPSTSNGLGAALELLIQSESSIYGNYISGAWFGIAAGCDGNTGSRLQKNIVIRNNVLYNINWHPIALKCYSSDSGEFSGVDIYNNTINTNRDNVYAMTYLQQDGTCTLDDINIKNNIATNGLGYAGSVSGTATNLTIDHNLFYGNATNDWNNVTDTNSVVDDPDFVGPASTYIGHTPVEGSPAINAGVNVGLAYTGSAPDIGAIEQETSIIKKIMNYFRRLRG